MTLRERNRFACALAEPLWDLGYEVRWRHEQRDGVDTGMTYFQICFGNLRGGFTVTEIWMRDIRSEEIAVECFSREIERRFAHAA